MKKSTKFFAFLLALVMLGLMIACDDTQDDTEPAEDETEKAVDAEIGSDVGNLAASFSMEIIGGDGTVSVKDFRGKAVVINFWATWCGPCVSELPEFSELAAEYSDELVIIAVHAVSGSDTAEAYVTANYSDSKIIFAYDEVLDATTGVYYETLGGIGYYPYTVVLDTNGVISYKQIGAMSYDTLKSEVDNVLGK